MDRMQTKNILLFCRDIDGEIALYRRILQNYEDFYYVPKTHGQLDGMPQSPHKISSPTENMALNIPYSAAVEMKELNEKITQRATLKRAILRELDRLPLQQKRILYDFYIASLQWVQISAQLHYSPTQCKKIRNRGLDNLSNYFKENYIIKNFNYDS